MADGNAIPTTKRKLARKPSAEVKPKATDVLSEAIALKKSIAKLEARKAEALAEYAAGIESIRAAANPNALRILDLEAKLT